MRDAGGSVPEGDVKKEARVRVLALKMKESVSQGEQAASGSSFSFRSSRKNTALLTP